LLLLAAGYYLTVRSNQDGLVFSSNCCAVVGGIEERLIAASENTSCPSNQFQDIIATPTREILSRTFSKKKKRSSVDL
jgi:hypothetical protein